MAFWELLLITRDFEMRRKSIFGEIDRQGGTTWAQISSICMAEIKTIKDRIEAFNRPAAPPAQATPEIQTLPRLSQPLRDDNVFTKPAPPKAPLDGAMDAFGNFAKAHGNAPGADPISPRARKLLEAGFTKLLPEGQKRPTSANVKESVGGILRDVLRSPFGTPYRQTFARRATAVICGSPISRSSSITVAIHALTQLITVSLKEDTYGCVQRDVLGIFRCFTTTVQSIEGFLRSLPPHWTDVEFKEQNRAEVEDVNELLQSLKGGLEGLLLVYGEYLQGLGAGGREVQAAKAMVAQGKPKEMIEAT